MPLVSALLLKDMNVSLLSTALVIITLAINLLPIVLILLSACKKEYLNLAATMAMLTMLILVIKMLLVTLTALINKRNN
jgi:hypothetical protein